jgi:hypothetical protein
MYAIRRIDTTLVTSATREVVESRTLEVTSLNIQHSPAGLTYFARRLSPSFANLTGGPRQCVVGEDLTLYFVAPLAVERSTQKKLKSGVGLKDRGQFRDVPARWGGPGPWVFRAA